MSYREMTDEDDDDDSDGIDLDVVETSSVTCARVHITANPTVTVKEDDHTTLDFGKHRGIELQDVPLQYMIFLSGYRMWYTERIPTDLPAYNWVKTNKSTVCASAEAYLQNRC